jgi:hypothetical protein
VRGRGDRGGRGSESVRISPKAMNEQQQKNELEAQAQAQQQKKNELEAQAQAQTQQKNELEAQAQAQAQQKNELEAQAQAQAQQKNELDAQAQAQQVQKHNLEAQARAQQQKKNELEAQARAQQQKDHEIDAHMSEYACHAVNMAVAAQEKINFGIVLSDRIEKKKGSVVNGDPWFELNLLEAEKRILIMWAERGEALILKFRDFVVPPFNYSVAKLANPTVMKGMFNLLVVESLR